MILMHSRSIYLSTQDSNALSGKWEEKKEKTGKYMKHK